MKYGRHQIDKAGEIIMSSKNNEDYDNAMLKINEWRTLHLPALDTLQKELLSLLNPNKTDIFLTSRRLKRITSILYKLDINPEMRLGGMQDIGGFRIVVNDIEALLNTKKVLSENIPTSFDLVKIMDYIQEPKESGYRSIHFIYKYKSTDDNTDGAKVELQIRTKLQHSWAMAVETAGLITSTPLKSSMGSDDWLTFFKIVSSLFSIKEKQPILKVHREQGYDVHGLMKLLYAINVEHNHSETLKVLNVSGIQAKKENFKNGYYILNINFESKIVKISAYSKEKENEASMAYSELEKGVTDKCNAVVLVSVPKMKELQDAYPSYFLNTSEFLLAIDTMMENCKKMKLIPS